LKKEDIGGFALARFGKIPPTPLYKGGNIIYGQALIETRIFAHEVLRQKTALSLSDR